MRARGPALAIAALCWLPLTGASLVAQFEARVDLSLSNRYVWHGLSRASGLVMQSSMAAGFRRDRLTFNAGVVRHHELNRPGPGELSELGTGPGRVGEDDVWAQGECFLGRLRFRSGVVRYLFRGELPEGGAGPLRHTTEIYAGAGVTGTYFNPTVEAWWDVARVHGGYLRVADTSPLLGWPLEPFVFISLAGEVGVNLGQAPDPSRPSDLANFAGRGVTHAALGMNILRRLAGWDGVGSASLDLGLNAQLNLDEATRYDGIGRHRKLIPWLSLGVTVLLGGEARSPR